MLRGIWSVLPRAIQDESLTTKVNCYHCSKVFKHIVHTLGLTKSRRLVISSPMLRLIDFPNHTLDAIAMWMNALLTCNISWSRRYFFDQLTHWSEVHGWWGTIFQDFIVHPSIVFIPIYMRETLKWRLAHLNPSIWETLKWRLEGSATRKSDYSGKHFL